MNNDYLNRLEELNNLVILMGCSSAGHCNHKKITRVRDIEPCSLTDQYLSSGSRMVMGNLWSVMDKDGYKMTKTLVKEIFDSSGHLKPVDSFKVNQLKK